jgi:hypothetical protein
MRPAPAGGNIVRPHYARTHRVARQSEVGVPSRFRSANRRVASQLTADSWALGSAVEHRLHTAGVSGSNPLAPTN